MFNPLSLFSKLGPAVANAAPAAAQGVGQAAGAMAQPAGLFQRLAGSVGNAVNRVGQNAAKFQYGDLSGFDPDIQKLMQRQALMSMGDRIAGRDSQQGPGIDAFTLAQLRRRLAQQGVNAPPTMPMQPPAVIPGRPIY